MARFPSPPLTPSSYPQSHSLTTPSYRDVVIRLEPIIMELERSENILIVTHQAILRCIYAYFMKEPQEKSPWLNVPLHTLIKLTPRAYGTDIQRYDAKIAAVSTWRGKGSVAKHEDPTPDTVTLGAKTEGTIIEEIAKEVQEGKAKLRPEAKENGNIAPIVNGHANGHANGEEVKA